MLAPSAVEDQPVRHGPHKARSTTELQTLLELGQGGMATAYLARALGTGGFERLVVLKRLSAQLASIKEAVDRFVAEARVAARLHHVNVVGTQQIGWDAEGPFIVLDYIEGGSLSDLLEAAAELDQRLPPDVVLRIALDVLAGLCAVHEATDGDGRPLDILHRDVSLENVLVGVSDGAARLSDFGVAKSVLGPSLTEPGCFVGKVLYFAPEYLLREPIGPTLDLYALGVTLWLALSGDELWPGKTDGSLARAIVEEGVPALGGSCNIPTDVREFVARACARDAKLRFQSAREMLAALEALERRVGFVASHACVAQCVERLLGRKLQARREAVARLLPELPHTRESGIRLELRETVRDPRNALGGDSEPARAEPSPATSSKGRRRLAGFVVPPLALGVLAAAASLWWRAPERPPSAPHVVASEVPNATAASAVGSAPMAPPATPEATPVKPLAAPVAEPPVASVKSARPPATAARQHRTEPKPTVPAASAVSDATHAPAEIARKNPYR
jgi:eukaryotic-like serine/threonine-protein kinase